MAAIRRFLGLILLLAAAIFGLLAYGIYKQNHAVDGATIFLGGLTAISALYGLRLSASSKSSSWRSDPATAKQIEFGNDLGIKFRRGMTKGEMSDLIDEAKGKRRR
jgi:hypothetical protein